MADEGIGAILLKALGLGPNPTPPKPQINEAQPWMTGYKGMPTPQAGPQGGQPQGGSTGDIDALLAEIIKQKQMAAGATGNPIPRP